MRTSAAQIEDIQKRLQILRQEREIEQRAFDQIAATHKDWCAAEIAEVARKRAAECEPKSIEVNETTISVGDYVLTLDDVQALLAAEQGILLPDPVKKVYLGEKGRVTRVIPSFQGKPAVEMCFADGAVKVFLTDCLVTKNCAKKRQKSVVRTVSEKGNNSMDSCVQRVPDYVAPLIPDPLPQPSWGTIQMPGRDRKVNLQDPLTCNTEKKTEGSPVPSNASRATPPKAVMCPLEGIGLVKEVMLDEQQRFTKALLSERLGSPLREGTSHQITVFSSMEHDNLLKTPRPDLLACTFPWHKTHSSLRGDDYSNKIPNTCPASYIARFSMDDTFTKIPRLCDKVTNVKQFFVAGVLSEKAELHFRPTMLDTSSTLQSILLTLTEELGWEYAGYRASRLFTLDGMEVKRLNDLKEGISLVVTTGFAFTSKLMQKPAMTSGPFRTSSNSSSAMATSTPPKAAAITTNASESHTVAPKFLIDKNYAPMGELKRPTESVMRSGSRVVEARGKVALKSTVSRVILTGKKQSTGEASRNITPKNVSGTGDVVQRKATFKEVPKESKRSDVGNLMSSFSDAQKSIQESSIVERESLPITSTDSSGKDAFSSHNGLLNGIIKKRPAYDVQKTVGGQGKGFLAHRSESAKRITKAINVRVFSNGEYGDKRTDCFPFRTVTLRPTHKTLKSFFNTIERSLEWNSVSKKVDVLYDAAGCEILSLDRVYEGQAIVASSGDKFVIPRPHTILYEDMVKIKC